MWNSETSPEVTVGEESMQESNTGNIAIGVIGHTNPRADASPFQKSTYSVSVTSEVFSTLAEMSSRYSIII